MDLLEITDWNSATAKNRLSVLSRPSISRSEDLNFKIKEIINNVHFAGDEALKEMTIKYKNIILEKIKNDGSLTDKSLSKALAKDGYLISDDLFNKTLLDLEIMGLINVSWITKNTRRVETVTGQIEDEVEIQNKKMLEKDYEASFPKANGTSS